MNKMTFCLVRKQYYIRVVHVAPPQYVVQVQVFGAVQVPLFKQAEAHTAETEYYHMENNSGLSNLRVAHVAPVHDDVQVQVFGAVHVPLFKQAEAQTAEKHGRTYAHIFPALQAPPLRQAETQTAKRTRIYE